MSTHEATTQQPLLLATDLKKYYPVKKGLFAPERLVKALDGVSFTLERGKTLAVISTSGKAADISVPKSANTCASTALLAVTKDKFQRLKQTHSYGNQRAKCWFRNASIVRGTL